MSDNLKTYHLRITLINDKTVEFTTKYDAEQFLKSLHLGVYRYTPKNEGDSYPLTRENVKLVEEVTQ